MLKADPLIIETVTRVCTDLCSAKDMVNAAEDGSLAGRDLWEAIAKHRLVTRLGAGVGWWTWRGSLADGFAVARVVGPIRRCRFRIAETLLCRLAAGGKRDFRRRQGPWVSAPARASE